MKRSIDPLHYRPVTRSVSHNEEPALDVSRTTVQPHLKKSHSYVWFGAVAYLIILSYGYVLAAPYLPRLSQYQRLESTTSQATITETQTLASVPLSTTEPVAGPNRLIVSSMGIEGEVYESNDESALSRGIWHRPLSSTPDKGGNTVLAAHRFKYLSGNNTFYNLDKVQLGDQISVVWEGRTYHYMVRENKVVNSRAISIEDPTEDPTLTLYTCTPLWTSEQRLVVVASLLGVD